LAHFSGLGQGSGTAGKFAGIACGREPRLALEQDNRIEVRDPITPVYDWFAEKFQTPDPK
jgi:hypothetical protein